MLSFAFCFVVDVACSVAKTRLCSNLEIQKPPFPPHTPMNVTRNNPSPSLPPTFSCSLFYITRSSFQDFGRKKKKKEVSHCFFNEPSTLFTRTLLHPASILSLDDLGFRLEDLRLDRESLIQGLFGLLNLRFGEARLCF